MLDGSVIDVSMELVCHHVLFIHMPSAVNKPHPIRVGRVLSIYKVRSLSIFSNLKINFGLVRE